MGTNSGLIITHAPANKNLRVSSMAPRINNGFWSFGPLLQADLEKWQASAQTLLFQRAVVMRMLKETDVLGRTQASLNPAPSIYG